MTIDQFYQYGSNDDILIIDEYDEIMNKNIYGIYNDIINGVWLLRGRNVFAFSATSSVPIERFVFKTISAPLKISFKSEYEFINGTSPL